MTKLYLKFISPNDERKYFIYEFVKGTGDMAMYCKGRVIGNKTTFDSMEAQATVALSVLKNCIHRGHKLEEYATFDDLEGDLFLEAFLEI